MVDANKPPSDAGATSSTDAKSADVPPTPPAGPVATPDAGTVPATQAATEATTNPDNATPKKADTMPQESQRRGLSEQAAGEMEGYSDSPMPIRPPPIPVREKARGSLLRWLTTDLDGK
jgi:hypothetical protein